MSETRRLTVAQATIEFLANQFSERDGVDARRPGTSSSSCAPAKRTTYEASNANKRLFV